MNNYVIYNTTTGRIVAVISSNAPMEAAQLPAGTAALAIPDGVDVGNQTHQIDVAQNPPVLEAFVATFAENQAAKAVTAMQYFATLFRLPAGFTYSGTLYQVDASSLSNITSMGALATASIANPNAVPWPSGFYWLAADNSHVAMTAAQMLAFAAAVAGYVSACVLRLRAIKDSIVATADQAALDAIDVTAGYPTASA